MIDDAKNEALRENKIGYNGCAHHWIPGEPLFDPDLNAAIDAARSKT